MFVSFCFLFTVPVHHLNLSIVCYHAVKVHPPFPPPHFAGEKNPGGPADAADATRPPRMLLLTRAWHPELDPAERMALRGLAGVIIKVDAKFSWNVSIIRLLPLEKEGPPLLVFTVDKLTHRGFHLVPSGNQTYLAGQLPISKSSGISQPAIFDCRRE